MVVRSTWRWIGRNLGRPFTAAGFLGLLALAFCWGRFGALPQATALPPDSPPKAGAPPAAPAPSDPSSEYARRWVAVINGNIPITREEFGEYLIARHSDKLELMVNRRIIDLACKQKGVEVTGAEIDAALAADLKGLQVNQKDFIDQVLKKYHKTLFEWKEDVIRPKLALAKLCRARVQVTDKDLQDAFEAYYGEKVDCRLILFPREEEKIALNTYGELRKSDEDFNRVAKQQASPTLASTGGQIKPIGRHTTGNEELEKEAFSLQSGEISRLIATPEGIAVLKCIKRIPPDKTKTLEKERPALEKEIIEKKIQAEIPKLFQELREQAQPKLFLKVTTTQADLERDVRRDLKSAAPTTGPRPPTK